MDWAAWKGGHCSGEAATETTGQEKQPGSLSWRTIPGRYSPLPSSCPGYQPCWTQHPKIPDLSCLLFSGPRRLCPNSLGETHRLLLLTSGLLEAFADLGTGCPLLCTHLVPGAIRGSPSSALAVQHRRPLFMNFCWQVLPTRWELCQGGDQVSFAFPPRVCRSAGHIGRGQRRPFKLTRAWPQPLPALSHMDQNSGCRGSWRQQATWQGSWEHLWIQGQHTGRGLLGEPGVPSQACPRQARSHPALPDPRPRTQSQEKRVWSCELEETIYPSTLPERGRGMSPPPLPAAKETGLLSSPGYSSAPPFQHATYRRVKKIIRLN